MNRPSITDVLGRLPEELDQRRLVVVSELKLRALWFIRLRWWVLVVVVVGTLTASLLRFNVEVFPLLTVALFIFVYNTALHAYRRRIEAPEKLDVSLLHRFTFSQVALDYVSMFLLIHYTGGVASPLSFFAIFHIVFAAILLPWRYAYTIGGVVTVGMALVASAEHFGWLSHHALSLEGETLPPPPLHHVLVSLGFFLAAITITAWSTTAVARMLRRRIGDLGELSERVVTLSERLQALSVMTQAIATRQHLDEVLEIVTYELTMVLEVRAVSVKLLSDDGTLLRYAAAHGLPRGWAEGKVVEVSRSPLHAQIIEGQPFIAGQTAEIETLQYGEELTSVGIRSVLFVPLVGEDKVIGVLGAYCDKPNRFNRGDVEFFLFAAELVALALENANAYDAAERATAQRARFTRQVAHNLRAPLGAVVSMVEVLREGYLGHLDTRQDEQLRRVERRVRTMLTLIDELLTLASSQHTAPTDHTTFIDLSTLAGRLERTFEPTAAEHGLSLSFAVAPSLPEVVGDANLFEQALENLISNAIKYTRDGGRVDVAFSLDEESRARIEVRDTGIGIRPEDVPRLFTEFFRAENARELEEIGTGLGLAIVKEVVDRMGGSVEVKSTLGEGSTFILRLPPAAKEAHAEKGG